MKRWILLFLLLFSIVALSFAQQNISAPQKFALVIGNGAYTDLARLNNPVNDANDMETSLRNLGFTVEKVLDGNIDQMESAIIRLKNRLSVSKNSYGFFFYAGHGVQSGGINYLIPVGARIPSENFLRERAVSVQSMLGELNDAGNELNIIVLDACRDNPFSWARSGSRGLTVVSNQPADSIIVYATSAGSTASDGTARNGLFTSQLLKHLNTPGVEVSELFRLTGADVSIASNRQQIPAVYNQFFGRAYLGSLPAAAPTPTAVQPAQTPSTATTPAPAATAQTTTTTQSVPSTTTPTTGIIQLDNQIRISVLRAPNSQCGVEPNPPGGGGQAFWVSNAKVPNDITMEILFTLNRPIDARLYQYIVFDMMGDTWAVMNDLNEHYPRFRNNDTFVQFQGSFVFRKAITEQLNGVDRKWITVSVPIATFNIHENRSSYQGAMNGMNMFLLRFVANRPPVPGKIYFRNIRLQQ